MSLRENLFCLGYELKVVLESSNETLNYGYGVGLAEGEADRNPIAACIIHTELYKRAVAIDRAWERTKYLHD